MKPFIVKILVFIVLCFVISKLLTLLLSALGGLMFTGVVAVIAWVTVGKLIPSKNPRRNS